MQEAQKHEIEFMLKGEEYAAILKAVMDGEEVEL